MSMIRSGCTTCRSVVEHGKAIHPACHGEHVGYAVPDPLGSMVDSSNGQVVGKDWKWIDQNLVFPGESQGLLLPRAVGAAEETWP